MTRIVLDDERVIAALDAIEQRAELCDPHGRILGFYVPNPTGEVFYRGVKSPLSPEERERLIREEGPSARPLSEFWDDMKKKHPDAYYEGFWDELKKGCSDPSR